MTALSERDWIGASGFLRRSPERVMACLDGLDDGDQRWRPSAAGANSLLAIAWHALGNAEENILEILGNQPVERDRTAEFTDAALDAAHVRERWRELEPQLDAVLRSGSDHSSSELVHHPRRGELTTFEVLVVALRHATEHMGQAELTRDLVLARRQGYVTQPDKRREMVDARADGERRIVLSDITIRPVANADAEDVNEIRRQPTVVEFTTSLPSERMAGTRRFIRLPNAAVVDPIEKTVLLDFGTLLSSSGLRPGPRHADTTEIENRAGIVV
jgi:hypothetical protein